MDEVLASGKPDFPFLICWANEPWTRSWDGNNRNVLLPQDYEAGWAVRFARDIAPILRDQRYFRLDGKPMLLIYRIGLIPEITSAVAQLRRELKAAQVSDVYLVACRACFPGDRALPEDPATLGFDAYCEFPPHEAPWQVIEQLPVEIDDRFHGCLCDYNRTVQAILERLEDTVTGVRHRGVMMGWDNTARRKDTPVIFTGATPTSFRRWLRRIVLSERRRGGERVVFVNAWNEWAEGTYLEPDRDFGHGWLEAVASALDSGVGN